MRPHWTTGQSTKEILDANSVQNGDCFETTSRHNKAGYGRIMIQGQRIMAHRIAYELAYGPIPEGLIVRHKCDNPPCIKPEHLELGTDADNMADRVERMSGPRGQDVHTSKLSEQEVQEIRRRVAGGESRRSVARSIGISHTAVNHLIKGKNWRHLKEAA